MPKLYMMVGLPASGKTTAAREIVKRDGNTVRLNRDLLREMLHYNVWSGPKEGITRKVQMAMTKFILTELKLNVVIDDTNLGPAHADRWEQCANNCNAKFEVIQMGTEVAECLRRDHEREDSVGSDVILNMAIQYDFYQIEGPIVICDIDGTIADVSHRLHFVDGEDKDWKSFFEAMEHDTPRLDVAKDVMSAVRSYNAELILMSGRPDSYRDVTRMWIEKHLPDIHETALTLVMRRSQDRRPDTEVKQQMLNTYIKEPNNVAVVFDDRPSVIRMWRENGLQVKDVGDGRDF